MFFFDSIFILQLIPNFYTAFDGPSGEAQNALVRIWIRQLARILGLFSRFFDFLSPSPHIFPHNFFYFCPNHSESGPASSSHRCGASGGSYVEWRRTSPELWPIG